MNLMLRIALPVLWFITPWIGIYGTPRELLFWAAVAAWGWWLVPKMIASNKAAHATMHRKAGQGPFTSSFDVAPAADGWAHFVVYPAQGKGPITSLPGFIGAVGLGGFGGGFLVGNVFEGTSVMVPMAVVGTIGGFLLVNWLIHGRFIRQYRQLVAAPNAFDVSKEGIRVNGTVIARNQLMQYRTTNPLTQSTYSGNVGATMVAGGAGAMSAAMVAGAAIHNTLQGAVALQMAGIRARTAAHCWVLEVVDTKGQVQRLAGGLTEPTHDALLHNIEQHLGA